MKELAPGQLKALSEFLNTIAAAWFTAGIISPFFIKIEDPLNVLILGTIAIIFSVAFLFASLFFVRKVKL